MEVVMFGLNRTQKSILCVVILAILLVSWQYYFPDTLSSGWNWTIGIVVVVSTFIVIMVSAGRSTSKGKPGRNQTPPVVAPPVNPTAVPATGTQPVAQPTATVVVPVAKVNSSGSNLPWVAIVIVLGVVGLLALIILVIGNFFSTLVQPNPNPIVTRTYVSVPTPVRASDNKGFLLPSLGDLMHTQQEKSDHFVVTATERKIPRAADGSNDWNISFIDPTDRFIMRGEKNGVSIGSWKFGEGHDRTIQFPNADDYWIWCENKAITEVKLVDLRK